MACGVLGDVLSKLVHESWLVSPEQPVNSYSLLIYYEESFLLEKETSERKENSEKEETTKQEILSLQEGNCTGSKTGASHLMHHAPGNIVVNMEICYT